MHRTGCPHATDFVRIQRCHLQPKIKKASTEHTTHPTSHTLACPPARMQAPRAYARMGMHARTTHAPHHHASIYDSCITPPPLAFIHEPGAPCLHRPSFNLRLTGSSKLPASKRDLSRKSGIQNWPAHPMLLLWQDMCFGRVEQRLG